MSLVLTFMELDKLYEELETVDHVEKPIVRIMWTGARFAAIADDGIHGSNKVIFSSKFNKHNGELYEVDGLEWTGNNYRVIGNIKYIGNIVDKNQQK